MVSTATSCGHPTIRSRGISRIALIGFVKSHSAGVSELAAHVDNDFCTVVLTATDGQPIANSSKLLLLAGGTVQNTGQAWNPAGTDVTAMGSAPTLIDLVKGTVVLRHIQNARSIRMQALDGAGQPLGAPALASRRGDDWTLPLGGLVTTWYEVLVSR